MRTVHCSDHLPRGVSGQGGMSGQEGLCLARGCLPGQGRCDHLHTPPGQNDRRLRKYNLSATTVADGNNN